MDTDRIKDAAAIIARNTGIDVLPAMSPPPPTSDECAAMILELTGHLDINKVAYRRDAPQIATSVARAHDMWRRLKGRA